MVVFGLIVAWVLTENSKPPDRIFVTALIGCTQDKMRKLIERACGAGAGKDARQRFDEYTKK